MKNDNRVTLPLYVNAHSVIHKMSQIHYLTSVKNIINTLFCCCATKRFYKDWKCLNTEIRTWFCVSNRTWIYITIRYNRRGNQVRTISRHRQHWTQKKEKKQRKREIKQHSKLKRWAKRITPRKTGVNPGACKGWYNLNIKFSSHEAFLEDHSSAIIF